MKTEIQQMLQAQAWERAKAELRSISAVSHFPGPPGDRAAYQDWRANCDARAELLESFIKEMEDNEYYLA